MSNIGVHIKEKYVPLPSERPISVPDWPKKKPVAEPKEKTPAEAPGRLPGRGNNR